jgi:hypothetical protein
VLQEVEAPTFLRQTANRWQQACQPYAPAALYLPGRFLVLISVRGRVDLRAIVWLKGLGKFENGMQSRDLPACSIVPQPRHYRVPPHLRDPSK